MIFLHLESCENKLLESDFSIFQKACFHGQTSLGMWMFLHGYDIFFEILTKELLKLSDRFVEKVRHKSTTVNVHTFF